MPRHPRNLIPRIVVVTCFTVALGVGGCTSKASPSRTLVRDANEPVAFAIDQQQRVLYAERTTGAIRRINADGHLEREPLARIPVSTDGQRGLLGLAIDGQGRTFIASTEPSGDRNLVVRELQRGKGSDGSSAWRVVWTGPKTETLANGGHLAFAPDGSLLIGVGELAAQHLRDVPALARTTSPGRILRLDPSGEARQRPTVVSAGWHNPFAFAVFDDGALWVADNAPGGTRERIARGDTPLPSEVTELEQELIPTALVQGHDSRHAYVCFLKDQSVRSIDLQARSQPSPPVAKTQCSRALIRVPGTNDYVLSTEAAVVKTRIAAN